MKLDSRGRERKPTQNNGSKKIPHKSDGKLTGVLTLADMPPDLTGHAATFWKWALGKMNRLGIAESADESALALAARRHGDMLTAREAIEREGSTIMDDSGNVKRNPNWITYEKAAVHLNRLLGDLGLTPSARAKLGAGVGNDDDPFAEFLRN